IEGRRIGDILARAGFSCTDASFKLKEMRSLLIKTIRRSGEAAVPTWNSSRSPGWHWPQFLNGSAPVPADAQIRLSGDTSSVDRIVQQAGTHEGQLKILKRAANSSAAVLFISAAASAPLLPFRADRTASGYSLLAEGDSSKGKTSLLRMANSVIGSPERLYPARSTEAGLEELMQRFRHLPLALDEAGDQRAGREKGMRTLAHSVSGGAPTVRHSRSDPDMDRIETITLVTKEGSLRGRSAGENVRLVTIPCNRMGRFGIIDRHEKAKVASQDEAAAWVEGIVAKLSSHHGHVVPAIVAAIQRRSREKTEAVLKVEIDKFLELAENKMGTPDRLTRRARQAFAFFAASGVLACRWGALPWKQGTVRASILRSLRWHEEHMLEIAGGEPPDIAEALRRVAAGIPGALAKHAPTEKSVGRVRAFRDHDFVCVRHSFFKELLSNEALVGPCLRRLDSNNLLIKGKRVGTYVHQHRFGEKRVWFLQFTPEFLERYGSDAVD
ncbi:MAG: DUF927 domain-containing protein, partial [Hyphomicrobiaceae bacterium]